MKLIDGLAELTEALTGETDISSFIIFAKEKEKHGKTLRAVCGNTRELLPAYAEIGMKLAEEIEMLSLFDLTIFINEYAKMKKKEE